MSPKLIRAGWIQRESSILKRWKENWFVLYGNGTLMYFPTPNSAECEGKIQLRRQCLYIRGGSKVDGVKPPDNRTQACLLSLKLEDGTELNLCTQSAADMTQWQFAVETMLQSQPPAHRPLGPSRSYSQGANPNSQNRAQENQRVVYPPNNQRTQPGVRPASVRRRSIIPAFLTKGRRQSLF